MREFMVGDVIAVNVGASHDVWLRMDSGWINQHGVEVKYPKAEDATSDQRFPNNLSDGQVVLIARAGHPVLERHKDLVPPRRVGFGN